jgi:hypothetical protein
MKKMIGIVTCAAFLLGLGLSSASAKDAHSDAQFHCRAACNSDWSNCHTTCSRKPADERDDCDAECTSDKNQCMTACDRL